MFIPLFKPSKNSAFEVAINCLVVYSLILHYDLMSPSFQLRFILGENDRRNRQLNLDCWKWQYRWPCRRVVTRCFGEYSRWVQLSYIKEIPSMEFQSFVNVFQPTKKKRKTCKISANILKQEQDRRIREVNYDAKIRIKRRKICRQLWLTGRLIEQNNRKDQMLKICGKKKGSIKNKNKWNKLLT